ncbi:MAG TPA: bifunctional 5,10-methylenetetrahydrofolate dehydrogenase/5,10-methenyltetrahydrofolate cyclohydrolase [bacterium]|nr:bifunctional 5,10-methylenetetrahydrofolate dehydrogenase/5,10-methenyltetrahydrofolate cyclohydrolase [bacterium]
MPIVFDGKKERDNLLKELKVDIAKREIKPVLAAVLVGDDPVSKSYVELKKRFGEQVGIEVSVFEYKKDTSKDEILSLIMRLNKDPEINGVMIQIPLPDHLNRDKMIEAIKPGKDVDGLRYCLGLDSEFIPPVILGIERAIDHSGINLANSKVTVVGQGFLVGKPLVRYLNGMVGVLYAADSQTTNLSKLTKMSDLVISGVGKAGLIDSSMIKDGAVLIDAGTSESNGEMRGDIESGAYSKAKFVTPVPGGIGPVTVAFLLSNVLKSYSL